MNGAFISIAIIAIILFLLIYSWYFSDKAVIKRKFKKTQHKKISEFVDGDVAKFTGLVESIDEPLISPLSKRKCTSYTVLVEQEESSGKHSSWKTLIKSQDSNTFIIRGANGCAYINGGKTKQHIVMDRAFNSGFMKDANHHLESYLKLHGLKSENFMGMNKTIRYKEGVLELGEKVAVLGKGKWCTPEELDLPAKLGKVLSISASADDDFIYLTDEAEATRPAEQKTVATKASTKTHVNVADKPKRRNKKTKREGRYLK